MQQNGKNNIDIFGIKSKLNNPHFLFLIINNYHKLCLIYFITTVIQYLILNY